MKSFKIASLAFEGRAAVVTGGGRGLGRGYLRKLMVNDYGGSVTGGIAISSTGMVHQ